MRILMFIFVGIALGDKLDRTYLPPPGSKLFGGSPGVLDTPLEYPKPFTSTIKRTQKNNQESSIDNISPQPTFIQVQQQLNSKELAVPIKLAFQNNVAQQQSDSQGFSPIPAQILEPTFEINQGVDNLESRIKIFEKPQLAQPAYRSNQELTKAQPGSQIFVSNYQQHHNTELNFASKEGQFPFHSQGFIKPELIDLEIFRSTSSTQSPPTNIPFQSDIPLITTSYAFSQTTISPFDGAFDTVPPIDVEIQLPYNNKNLLQQQHYGQNIAYQTQDGFFNAESNPNLPLNSGQVNNSSPIIDFNSLKEERYNSEGPRTKFVDLFANPIKSSSISESPSLSPKQYIDTKTKNGYSREKLPLPASKQTYSNTHDQDTEKIEVHSLSTSKYLSPDPVSQLTIGENNFLPTASTIPSDIGFSSSPLNIQKDYSIVQNNPENGEVEANRKAEIVHFENSLSLDGKYSFNFDTSNGIHMNENGTSKDGVKAQGSYSYIGNDGKLYSVKYSADEKGFLPIGDHLPTPPPIPDAIKRVIEQALRNKKAGIFNDGSYDESKYGYMNYEGKMKINNDSNKIQFEPELDNGENNIDYETFENEIDDIKLGNRGNATSNINDQIDSADDLQYSTPENIPIDIYNKFNSTQQSPHAAYNTNKPSFSVFSDAGMQNYDGKATFLKKPSFIRSRPTNEFPKDIVSYEHEHAREKSRTQTKPIASKYGAEKQVDRQRPKVDVSSVNDENSGNNYEMKKRLLTQSQADDTKRPNNYDQTSQNKLQKTEAYSENNNSYSTIELTPSIISTSSTSGLSSNSALIQPISEKACDINNSTKSTPSSPYQASNKNDFSETKPTYLPTSEYLTANEQQRYPSDEVPSTKYPPNYTLTTPNSDEVFETNTEYKQDLQPSKRPAYAENVSDDNNTDITKQLQLSSYPQTDFSLRYEPDESSTTEIQEKRFGLSGAENKQNEIDKTRFGSPTFRPIGNDSPAINKVIGEDFRGQKRPHSYDPETGYYYK